MNTKLKTALIATLASATLMTGCASTSTNGSSAGSNVGQEVGKFMKTLANDTAKTVSAALVGTSKTSYDMNSVVSWMEDGCGMGNVSTTSASREKFFYLFDTAFVDNRFGDTLQATPRSSWGNSKSIKSANAYADADGVVHKELYLNNMSYRNLPVVKIEHFYVPYTEMAGQRLHLGKSADLSKVQSYYKEVHAEGMHEDYLAKAELDNRAKTISCFTQ